MVMQEASTGSQQDGGESRYVNGARIIPRPPRALAAPGWAWCRPGWGQIRASRTPEAGALLSWSLEPLPLGAHSPSPGRAWSPRLAASQPTTATATLWNFQFSANVRVVTEAERPWSDIMAEEL